MPRKLCDDLADRFMNPHQGPRWPSLESCVKEKVIEISLSIPAECLDTFLERISDIPHSPYCSVTQPIRILFG